MSAPQPTVRTFALIGAAEAIARGVPLSVYPLALYRASGDAVAVSQIYLAVGFASLATVLSVPMLLRALPRRWAHTLGVALYVLSALLGMAGGWWVALALLATALATAIAFVCYNANTLDYVAKADLARLESRRLLYAGVGWAVGPFVGVWLFGRWHGAPFVVVAAAAVAMGVLIWRMGMGSTRLQAPSGSVSPNPLRYLRRFAVQPRLVAGWYLAVVRSCGWAVYLVYVGIFAVQNGLPDTVGGITASLASASLFLAPLLLRWVQRRPVREAVRAGFLGAGACFAAAAALSPWPWLAIALLVAGAYCLVLLDLCGGLPFLLSVKPSERAEMSAVFSTFRDLANIVTPALVWLVLQVAPLAAVFGAGGLLLLSAWVVAGRIHPQLGVPAAQRSRAGAAR